MPAFIHLGFLFWSVSFVFIVDEFPKQFAVGVLNAFPCVRLSLG